VIVRVSVSPDDTEAEDAKDEGQRAAVVAPSAVGWIRHGVDTAREARQGVGAAGLVVVAWLGRVLVRAGTDALVADVVPLACIPALSTVCRVGSQIDAPLEATGRPFGAGRALTALADAMEAGLSFGTGLAAATAVLGCLGRIDTGLSAAGVLGRASARGGRLAEAAAPGALTLLGRTGAPALAAVRCARPEIGAFVVAAGLSEAALRLAHGRQAHPFHAELGGQAWVEASAAVFHALSRVDTPRDRAAGLPIAARGIALGGQTLP
jgi:hypothetical protein